MARTPEQAARARLQARHDAAAVQVARASGADEEQALRVIRGPKGERGPEGPQGEQGEEGRPGPVGPRGLPGEEGARGEQGMRGADGSKGEKGDTGPAGKRGATGATGNSGWQGDRGLDGAPGTAGPPGATGATGATGPGVPTGGAAGTFLRKTTTTDFDDAWATIAQADVSGLTAALAGKQATGNYVTALTGDVTAAGPGSATATLATVNANTGSWGDASHVPQLTLDAKGRVTAAGNVSIAITSAAVSGLGALATVSNLTGDVTSIGAATSLPAVGTAGTYGDATHVPQFTTDTKGRITAVTAVLIAGGSSSSRTFAFFSG